jgi:hypothetical protein
VNIKNTIISLVIASIIILTITGCQKAIPTPVSETACATDSDCACGTHKDTGDCFVGNKAFVNVEKQCPDFCTGIAGNLYTECVSGTCQQLNRNPETEAECTTDSDCIPAQCCHPTTCIPVEKKGVCNLACTMNCAPGTLDCGGSCTCEEGKCIANLNDL